MKQKTKKIIKVVVISVGSGLALFGAGFGLCKIMTHNKIKSCIKAHEQKEIEAGSLSNKIDCIIMENNLEPDVVEALNYESMLAAKEEYAEQKLISTLKELDYFK